MIRTKSIYAPIEDCDGERILITRFYPRGVRREQYDVWARQLAPSAGLLKKYKTGQVSWGEFQDCLLAELRGSISSVEAIYALHRTERDATLLCYERDGQPCHRHVIRDLIEEPGRLGPGQHRAQM